jgi:hypothetical protein
MLTPKKKEKEIQCLTVQANVKSQEMVDKQYLTSSHASFTCDQSYQVDLCAARWRIDVHLEIGTTKKKNLRTDKVRI